MRHSSTLVDNFTIIKLLIRMTITAHIHQERGDHTTESRAELCIGYTQCIAAYLLWDVENDYTVNIDCDADAFGHGH